MEARHKLKIRGRKKYKNEKNKLNEQLKSKKINEMVNKINE